MTGVWAILLWGVVWIVWAFACRRIMDNPRGDAATGLALVFIRTYARLVHRVSVRGAEHIPGRSDAGPLIVVCNHTAGVDPLLVQSVCDFEVRWMMGEDMQWDALRGFWEFAGVIGVNRVGRDTTSARIALRHLEAGGIVGVFPEGRLEKPARRLLPFQAGVGLLISRSEAPVLPVWIDGTPNAPTAWGSLFRTSRSRLTIGPRMMLGKDERGNARDAKAITELVRGWFERVSGWPSRGG